MEKGPVSGRVAWSSGSLSFSPLIFKMGLMSHLPGHCKDYSQHTVAQVRSQGMPKVTVDRKKPEGAPVRRSPTPRVLTPCWEARALCRGKQSPGPHSPGKALQSAACTSSSPPATCHLRQLAPAGQRDSTQRWDVASRRPGQGASRTLGCGPQAARRKC